MSIDNQATDVCQTSGLVASRPRAGEEVLNADAPNIRELIASTRGAERGAEREAGTSNIHTDDNVKSDNSYRSPPPEEIPPKAGQKYWLSSEAKKRKNIYMREYYIRKKEQLEQLQQHQLKPRDLELLMVNNQIVSRHLDADADYEKLIKNLLDTLVDNKILKDYEFTSELNNK